MRPLTLDELWLQREFKAGTGGRRVGEKGKGDSGTLDMLSDGVMDLRSRRGEPKVDSGGEGVGKCAADGVDGGSGKSMPSPPTRRLVGGGRWERDGEVAGEQQTDERRQWAGRKVCGQIRHRQGRRVGVTFEYPYVCTYGLRNILTEYKGLWCQHCVNVMDIMCTSSSRGRAEIYDVCRDFHWNTGRIGRENLRNVL